MVGRSSNPPWPWFILLALFSFFRLIYGIVGLVGLTAEPSWPHDSFAGQTFVNLLAFGGSVFLVRRVHRRMVAAEQELQTVSETAGKWEAQLFTRIEKIEDLLERFLEIKKRG